MSDRDPNLPFFTNRDCPYFPCHEGVDPDDFNCLFCFCPLYALGDACGGRFAYSASGKKSCVNCPLPHIGNSGNDMVKRQFARISRLAQASGPCDSGMESDSVLDLDSDSGFGARTGSE